MKINRDKLYELYMNKVDKITETCDWVTTFAPKDIVHLISSIIENNPDLIISNTEDSKDFIYGVDNNDNAYFRFPVDNNIKYLQDFSVLEGTIPPHIKFYPTDILSNGLITFIGDGYGILNHHRLNGINGGYGCGAISIYSKSLPDEFVAWCKSNLLLIIKDL